MSMWDVVSRGDAQRRVDAHFAATVTTWTEIYRSAGVVPVIHQQRRAVFLRWIDELAVPRGERVLEVGAGAGLTAVTLAERGLRVDAVDAVGAMVERARQAAAEAGVSHLVTATVGDGHHLRFPDGTFHLVLAMGVLPWLHSPRQALSEMARVVKPGGYVLVSAHNRWRLIDVLDPWVSPPLVPIKRAAGAVLRRVGLRRARPYLEPVAQVVSKAEFDRWLRGAGLTERKSVTLGFGPFTLFRRSLLPNGSGVSVHRVLQRWGDRGVPLLRSSGAQHIVLAQKGRSERASAR